MADLDVTLEPCPFCGGKAMSWRAFSAEDKANCRDINCAGYRVVASHAAWNRRSPPPDRDRIAASGERGDDNFELEEAEARLNEISTPTERERVLEEARQELALVVAYIGRDQGTDRLDDTLSSLVQRCVLMISKIEALASPLRPEGEAARARKSAPKVATAMEELRKFQGKVYGSRGKQSFVLLNIGEADRLIDAILDLGIEADTAALSARPQPPQQAVACMDCGGDYDAIMALSLLLPKAQWLQINPEDGGVLCANCMLRRASALPGAINITGRITFGDDAAAVYADGSRPSGELEKLIERLVDAEIGYRSHMVGGLLRDCLKALYAAALTQPVAEEFAKHWHGEIEAIGAMLGIGAPDAGEVPKAVQALLSARPQPPQQAVETITTYFARQIEWSRETFGPALRTKGVLDHIRKELTEIEAKPHDLSEWIDVVILAMDGFWRHGGTAETLLQSLLAKQQRNMARTWPDWRTRSEDQAIEHDRSGEIAAPLTQPVATVDRDSLIERLGKTREALNDAGYFGESPEGRGDPEVRALDEAIAALTQPVATAGEPAWIEWYGGHQPVPKGTRVDFKVFPDHEFLDRDASAWDWGPARHPENPAYGSIIAYRLRPLPQPKEEGE